MGNIQKYAFLNWEKLIHIFFPLLIIGAFVWQFHIEENLQLPSLILVVIGGFFIYNFLPTTFRLPGLFFLNIVALFVLFEPLEACLILSLCLSIFVMLYLPFSLQLKKVILLLAGAGLLYIRTFADAWPETQNALAIVGALFMFRSILYLYEARFIKEKIVFWKQINYFFLLPNWIFMIFPVVDFKTFHRNYHPMPSLELSQKGIRWMALGVFHLFIYRILYYYFLPDPADIQNVFSLLQYFLIGYGLTIRLSGIFHLSVGIICLFGFDLPKVFSNHFLANGFNDLWRRINIYWKDFIMKVFYFPIYFRIKKIGQKRALLLTILIIFFFNWLLHAYQWQWIRGSFLFTLPDMLFWAIFGVLVAMGSIWQLGQKRKVNRTSNFDWLKAGIKSIQILGMLALMCVLYTLWISPSMDDFLQLFILRKSTSISQIAVILLITSLAIPFGVLLQYIDYRLKQKNIPYAGWIFEKTLIALLAFGILFSMPLSQNYFKKISHFDTQPVLNMMLNKQDQDLQFRGYYESLIHGNNLTSQIFDLQQINQGNDLKVNLLDLVRTDSNSSVREFQPNLSFQPPIFTSNEFGMRDKFYPKDKPDQTLRFALVGGSVESGMGINDTELFEYILEERLNDWGTLGEVEILNFATPRSGILNHMAILESNISSFQPDAVLMAVHPFEWSVLGKNIIWELDKILANDSSWLKKTCIKAGLQIDEPVATGIKKLQPYREELMQWAYASFYSSCQKHDMMAIRLEIPSNKRIFEKKYYLPEKEYYFQLAEQTGYITIRLEDKIYGDYKPEELRLNASDGHPNALANRLIAQGIFEQIIADKKLQQALIGSKK